MIANIIYHGTQKECLEKYIQNVYGKTYMGMFTFHVLLFYGKSNKTKNIKV